VVTKDIILIQTQTFHVFGFAHILEVVVYSGKVTVQIIEPSSYLVIIFYSKVRCMHQEALRLLKIAQRTAPVVHGFKDANSIRIRVYLVLYELKIVDLLFELHQKVLVC